MKPFKVHKKDYKYVPKDVASGFDAERNKRIIDEVIEETDRVRARKKREFTEQLKERTDAVATYLHSIEQGGSTSNILRYFGRKHLSYLRGKQILEKIQAGLTVVKNGKVIKRAGE